MFVVQVKFVIRMVSNMTDSTEVKNDEVAVEKKPVSKKKVSKKSTKTGSKKDDGTVILKSNHDSDLKLHTGVDLPAGKSVRVDAKVLNNYVIGCWLKAKVIEVQKG